MNHNGLTQRPPGARIRTVVTAVALVVFSATAHGEITTDQMIERRMRQYSPTGEIVFLDMESAIGTAINNSFDLKVIDARQKIYDLTIIERVRDFFPSLGLSYTKSDQVSLRTTDSRQRKLVIDSDVVLFDGGKRYLSYSIAKLQAVLARNDYRIAVNKLILDVMGMYLQILETRGTIEIHRKTLDHGRMQLSFIKKELELGEATRFDMMEIDAKVKGVELELEKAIDNYFLALNKFKLLLKIDWRQPIELVGDIDRDFNLKPMDTNTDVNEYIGIALKNRKEVESSDVEFLISKKNSIIDRLYFFPKISVGFNYSLSDDNPVSSTMAALTPAGQQYRYSSQFLPRQKGWGVNIKITSALFGNTASLGSGYDSSYNGNTRAFANSARLGVLDSMDYRRKMKESTINMHSAAEKKREIREQVSLEVLSSVMTLQNSWHMIGIADQQLSLYDNQLVIERLKANMGESRRYDLIKKEIERGQAAISQLDSKVKYLTAASALELSMGVDIGFLKLYQLRK